MCYFIEKEAKTKMSKNQHRWYMPPALNLCNTYELQIQVLLGDYLDVQNTATQQGPVTFTESSRYLLQFSCLGSYMQVNVWQPCVV